MTGENINIPLKPLRVLVSPLHWGLGHATRIIPVIKILQAAGAEVIIAANDGPAALLRKEFPVIEIIAAPSLQLRYPRKGKWFFFKMLLQMPSLFSVLRQENKWLEKLVAENRIDAVISDNRFGLSTKKVPCIFITHQLFINAPAGFLRWAAQKINYFYINRFTECWVPDIKGAGDLAGKLSHPAKLPSIPVHYLGPLSRLKKIKKENEHILILLSGPEPQRSIWEQELIRQLPSLHEKLVFVRGLPASGQSKKMDGNVLLYDHVSADTMNELINAASVVIARSGYSTIMDIAAVGKKAVLVPTSGQTEQEYLAAYLAKKQLFLSFEQHKFDLKEAVEKAASFDHKIPETDFESVNKELINDWVNRLRMLQSQ